MIDTDFEKLMKEHEKLQVSAIQRKNSYHLRKIGKAEYGTFEKILEEAEEFIDAVEQNCYIMAWLELSDLYGALQGMNHKVRISDEFTNLNISKDELCRRYESLKSRKTLVSADRFFNICFNYLRFSIGEINITDVISMSKISK